MPVVLVFSSPFPKIIVISSVGTVLQPIPSTVDLRRRDSSAPVSSLANHFPPASFASCQFFLEFLRVAWKIFLACFIAVRAASSVAILSVGTSTGLSMLLDVSEPAFRFLGV